jgi:hypothetical protein
MVALDIYYLASYRKSLLTPEIQNVPVFLELIILVQLSGNEDEHKYLIRTEVRATWENRELEEHSQLKCLV